MKELNAKVIRSHQREFECSLDETKELIKAKAHGNLLKKGNTIVVGDNIVLSKSLEREEYIIKKVYPRENEVFRVLVREAKKKITAANIDYLILISSSGSPKFKRGLIDRFLIRSYQWNLRPLIVFNKMDEYTGEDFDINFEVDRLKNLNVEYFELSAIDLNYKCCFLENDFSELEKKLKGTTSLFIGQSGVGKSTIISSMSKGKTNLKTGSIGKKQKGVHTTTWSEIIDMGDFFLVDSPGIRSFSLDDIIVEELITFFPDLEEIAIKCKFLNCTHLEQNKGCAFYNEEFIKNSEIKYILSRLSSYLALKEEISSTPTWKKEKKYN